MNKKEEDSCVEVYSLTTFVYRSREHPMDNPKINHFIVKDEETLKRIISRFENNPPWVDHANELLQLYLNDEKNWLMKTARYASTLDFFYSEEWKECENEDEVIDQIITLEFFNYNYCVNVIDTGKQIMYSSDTSYL